jgi:hypothetical protein
MNTFLVLINKVSTFFEKLTEYKIEDNMIYEICLTPRKYFEFL